MLPSSTTIDARSAAFHQALPVRLRLNPRRELLRPSRPRACAEPQKIQPSKIAKNPVHTTSAALPAVSPRVHDKDGLIYRPEAVLSILALGFLSSMAFIANSGRRIAADVSARANRIAQDKSQARRYKARLREKEFLESAIEATAATLSNTEDFLMKQIKRAELGEQRLRELEVSSAEVDAATRKTKELKLQLQEKEAELENKRLRTEENTELLATIQADVCKRRETLASFEKDAQEAQRELRKAQQTASESLKSALGERQHLEAVLEQKQAQLAEEMAARDSFLQRISEEEDKLHQTETLVDHTLNSIEARRQKIDTVAKEAEHIGKVASQEKLALETAVVREVRADDVEESLRQISEKQSVVRSQIQRSEKSQAQQASLCADLKNEIEERNKLLEARRAKLSVLNRGKKSTRKSQESDHEVSAQREKNAPDAWRIAADGTGPHDVFESAVIDDNIQSTCFSNSSTSAKPKAPIAPNTTVVDGDQVPVKRRRGRPRKTEAEGSRDPQLTKSKRGRGRPRTRPSDDSVKETAAKRKRGRPRKTPVTAIQERTAQRSNSSSLTQHQDSSN